MQAAERNATGERIAGPDAVPADLLDVKALSKRLACSPRHAYRLADAGKLPSPVRLGCLVRWRRAEIEQWISDGCPNIRKVGAR
jgi:excisionase family DNA binding protein